MPFQALIFLFIKIASKKYYYVELKLSLLSIQRTFKNTEKKLNKWHTLKLLRNGGVVRTTAHMVHLGF